MHSMVFSLLTDAWGGLGKDATVKDLPRNLFLFRDGVPDNRLKETHSKEVVGLQRGIRRFKHSTKGIAKWNPKIEFLVSSKTVLDRFGVATEGRNGIQVRPLEVPVVLCDKVTSYRLWDFLMWPFSSRKRANRTKCIRYLVLKDEMNLSKNGGAWDLFQFIHALGYTYVSALLFLIFILL